MTDKTNTADTDTVPCDRTPRTRGSRATPTSPPFREVAGRGAAASPDQPAGPTKLDLMVTLLRRKEGATLADLCDATGWQAHSVRGAMAGALKKKGHLIRSETVDSIRHYRIGGCP